MAITASMVKDLRTRTGVGMMDCKKALTETDGDIDAAVELLRKQGAASADKKADRIAAEGQVVVICEDDASCGAVVEVNSETDFVSKADDFAGFVQILASCVLRNRPENLQSLLSLPIEVGCATVEETRRALIGKVGENIQVRRFSVQTAEAGARVCGYQHGSRIGVLVTCKGGRYDLGRDLAMHIAASRPGYLDESAIPETVQEKEREIYRAQVLASGKPEAIVEKILTGKMRKFLNEVTLLGQAYVKDTDLTVKQLLDQEQATVSSFVRYEQGEGLEKRVDDFAAEVKQQAGI